METIQDKMTIGVFEAVERMKASTAAGEPFSFAFRKWDRQRRRGGDLRRVCRAVLRPKAGDDDVADASHKLFFRDVDTGENLVCWQPLIVEFNGMATILS